MYLTLDLVDVRLQLIIVQAVCDRISGEVEEGDEYGGYVVLVLCDPGRSDYTVGEGGRCWGEG